MSMSGVLCFTPAECVSLPCRCFCPVSPSLLDDRRGNGQRYFTTQVLNHRRYYIFRRLQDNISRHTSISSSKGCDGRPTRLVSAAQGVCPVGGAGGLRLCAGPDVGPGASCRLPQTQQLLHHLCTGALQGAAQCQHVRNKHFHAHKCTHTRTTVCCFMLALNLFIKAKFFYSLGNHFKIEFGQNHSKQTQQIHCSTEFSDGEQH